MRANIEKLIGRLDAAQLKEIRRMVSMAKSIIPNISTAIRLYTGKDIIEETEKFLQNPNTYQVVQSGIIDFIEKIKADETAVTKGIFLSQIEGRLMIACIHISPDSVVSISEVSIDGKELNTMSFIDLIQLLGIDKIQIKKTLSDVDDLVKARMEQLKGGV